MSQGAVFIQGAVFYLLAYSATSSVKKRRTRRLIAGIRPRHVALALVSLAGVVAVLVGLERIGGVLSIGWWGLLGGQGSVMTGGVAQPAAHPLAKPLMVGIPLALLLNVPAFAFKEEVWFRRKAASRTWLENAKAALVFGLIHMVAGIPLSAALAIAGFGWVLTWQFIRMHGKHGPLSALYDVARIHCVYNAVIVTLLVTVLILKFWVG